MNRLLTPSLLESSLMARCLLLSYEADLPRLRRRNIVPPKARVGLTQHGLDP